MWSPSGISAERDVGLGINKYWIPIIYSVQQLSLRRSPPNNSRLGGFASTTTATRI
jgi:hypothetical protein